MKFIKLTELNGKKIIVNLEKVDMAREHTTEGTDIYFAGDEMNFTRVIESVEKIYDIIEEEPK